MKILEDFMTIKKTRLFIVLIIVILYMLSACTGLTTSNDFTINFNSNDGTSIDNMIYNGMQIITMPDNPTKEGYTFDGWYWDNESFEKPFTADSLLDTPITNNLTVYAKWDINSYTLQFLDSDGTVLRTQDYEFNMDLSSVTPPTATKEGYTFDRWDHEIPNNMPAEDVTLTAQYSINQYTITFDTNEGSLITAITQDYETVVNAPSPTKEGYTFNGWYSDSEFKTAYSFTTMPAEDMTVYAKWDINSYTLQFLDSDGTVLRTQDYEFNMDLSSVTPPTATKEGYTFDRWDHEIPNNMPAEDVTISAFWIPNLQTISFEVNNGTLVVDIVQFYDSELIKPENPTREGYTFDGWYSDNTLSSAYELPEKMPLSIKLYAKWSVNQYAITLDIGGEYLDDKQVSYGEVITSLPIPKKDYSLFLGWQFNEEILSFPFVFSETTDIVLTAKWIEISEVFLYETINNEIKIISYIGDLSVLTVPNYIENLPVTTIGHSAFEANDILTYLELGTFIEKIEYDAFRDMSSLIEIKIPNSTQEIGTNILRGANKLETITLSSELDKELKYFFGNNDYFVPSSLNKIIYATGAESINKNLLNGNLHEVVIQLASDWLEIESYQFSDTNITEIILPSNLMSIGNFAFSGSIIANISIPKTVKSIGIYAFANTDFLAEVSFETGSQLTSIQSNMFLNASSLSSIVIPSSVTTIDRDAFKNAIKLTSVVFEEDSQLNLIRANAFEGSSLISISLPNKLKEIGYKAFYNTPLSEIFFETESSLEIIDSYAFSNTKLSSVLIPASTLNIREHSFSNTSLVTINFEEGSKLEVIGDYAFYETIIQGITIPSSTRVIGYRSFYNIRTLITVNFESESILKEIGEEAFRGISSKYIVIPKSVEIIGSDALSGKILFEYGSSITSYYMRYFSNVILFDHVQFIDNGEFLGSLQSDNTITILGLSASVTEIDLIIPAFIEGKEVNDIISEAFANEDRLLSITIPYTITRLRSNLFNGANNLLFINFDEYSQLKEIDEYAFLNATSVKKIIIPKSVEVINQGAFKGMSSLEEISLPFVGKSRDSHYFEAVFGYVFGFRTVVGDTFHLTKDPEFYDLKLDSYYSEETWQYTDRMYESTASYTTHPYTYQSYYYYIPTSLTKIEITNANVIEGPAFMNMEYLHELIINEEIISIDSFAFKGAVNLTIYTKLSSKPTEWDDNWNTYGIPVVWGYEEE
jgi:uncharacterized repeat protein (TIGR02543 family)